MWHLRRDHVRLVSSSCQGGACILHLSLGTQTNKDIRSALSFHAVSFGVQAQAGSLRRMVQIAMEVHDAAPRDPLAPPGNACSYSEALDMVRRVGWSLSEYSCLHRRADPTRQYFLADCRLAAQPPGYSQASYLVILRFDVELVWSPTAMCLHTRFLWSFV